ncbi:MAG: DUF2867 domain-containing protein [bacterium]|nr:DUF2867 domain-containing protein [bacterium]
MLSILLTGATGYIGGRLLYKLHERGHAIRCLCRNPDFIRSRAPQNVEIHPGDVRNKDSIVPAMQGMDVAVYLIHSMASHENFAEADRLAARNFAEAVKNSSIGKIIYVGGLGESDDDLSPHLKSRQEVGAILRESGVDVIELRASIVIGSGSLSFEMIRSLVERLPVMITPRWVSVPAQPIAINDLLDYLVESIECEAPGSRIYEIGGAEIVSYGGIMKEYARQRGLKRFMIPVPFLTPFLSSLWLGLVTPIYARVGRKLIDSIRHPTVVKQNSALTDFSIKPVGIQQAIQQALLNEDLEIARTRWCDALSSGGDIVDWRGVRFGSRIIDTRSRLTSADLETVFSMIESIGGETGWFYGNWLWRVRGAIDLLVGGVGMRRGRRDPRKMLVGDAVDFWRVEDIIPAQRIRLRAEMKLPGRAWLQFELETKEHLTEIHQTAIFDPVGLGGLAYWYALYPIHQFIFDGMLRNIAIAAEKR